jgi:hypothetical protein
MTDSQSVMLLLGFLQRIRNEMRASTNPIKVFSFLTPSLFGVIVRSTTTSQADNEELNAHFLPGLFHTIQKSTGTVPPRLHTDRTSGKQH